MVKYLWYLSGEGAIQKEAYYKLYDEDELTAISESSVPKFYPIDEYGAQLRFKANFDWDRKYNIQNVSVFDLKLSKTETYSIVAYAQKKILF